MSASQSGVYNTQQFTDMGAPLVGGRLYTYAFGTTTHKTAFTDHAGAIPHTYSADGLGGQFIALDARGELPAPLYLTGGSYDLALKTAAGATVWTRRADPVWDITSDLSASSGATLVGYMPAGVGAVATTVETTLRRGTDLNIEGHGADTSYTAAANTAAIQALLTLHGAAYVPDGNFSISSLTLPVNSKIYGDGVLTCPAGGTGITALSGSTITGIKIVGNGATYAIIASGDDVTVRGNKFSGDVGHYVVAYGNRVSIDNNQVDGSSATSITTPFVVNGNYPTFSNGCTVSGNTFYDTLGFGIQTRLNAASVIISGNVFHQPSFQSSITATAAQTVFNFTLAKVVARKGIQVNGVPVTSGVTFSGTGPTYTATFSAGRTAGEVVTLIGFRALENININSRSYDVSVTGNVMDGTGDSGIVMCADYLSGALGTALPADYPTRITITGNSVKNCAYSGITQTVPSGYATITGNTVADCSMLLPSGYFSSGISFSGERISCNSNIINSTFSWMESGIHCGTYSVVSEVYGPSIVMGGNTFNGAFIRNYNIPNQSAGVRKRSILVTDGLITDYPAFPDLDSAWANKPALTPYFFYGQSGSGWNRDTVNIQGGTASLATVAGDYVDIGPLASATFKDGIVKVGFWAKAQAAGNGYVQLHTTLIGANAAQTITITNTSWTYYEILCPHQDLTAASTFLRIGGTAGVVNVQHIRLSVINIR